jgi:hypothetical protein
MLTTTPAVTAFVSWGKKPLGKITPTKPLVVSRPRDSGPLDVVVRAEGYLPVQTRAHTFSDHRILVKLTLIEDQAELLGYRAPLDAGVDLPEQAAIDAMGPPAPAPLGPPSPLLPAPGEAPDFENVPPPFYVIPPAPATPAP